ncbi:methionine-R-sulfoxide reductase B2, mitochondrial isoform X1 [Orcinus orca]|uniref:methionine-R-sulfoxide reductase B2, mitochondrial isoform X1 n=1 Tax=Orcinus orca TaxID=9733 RepID=UPI00211305CD|nr:methionine-R-sulfoxide reductase B2, mitochondrial isoform X1 [Orcinus orca]
MPSFDHYYFISISPFPTFRTQGFDLFPNVQQFTKLLMFLVLERDAFDIKGIFDLMRRRLFFFFLWYAGLSLLWPLPLQSTGSGRAGSAAWLTGLAAPWHVGSSRTGARTRVPCIGRRTLNHCATREARDGVFNSGDAVGRFLWNQWFTELALGSGRGGGNRIVLGRKMIWGIKCSLYGNSLHSCNVMMSNTALRKSTARALDGLRFLRLRGRLALMRVTQGSCDVWTPRWDQLAQRSSASRGHRFEPWSRRIPHAAEQLSHCSEKPARCNKEQPPLTATRESLRAATKTQRSQKKKKLSLLLGTHP